MPTRLIEYLTSKKGKEEDEKKAALVKELERINDFLVRTCAAHDQFARVTRGMLCNMASIHSRPPWQRSWTASMSSRRVCLQPIARVVTASDPCHMPVQEKNGPLFGGNKARSLCLRLLPA